MKLANKGAFSIDKFIPLVLGVFIFTALIGSIAGNVTNVLSQNGTNVTGGAGVLLALTTLILVIGFIIAIYKHRNG